MKLVGVVLIVIAIGLILSGCAVNVVVAPHASVDVGYAYKAGENGSH